MSRQQKDFLGRVRSTADSVSAGADAIQGLWDRWNSRRAKQDIEEDALDCFTLLGLTPDSTTEVIKRQWARIARVYHPDSACAVDDTMFKVLHAAYQEAMRLKGEIHGRQQT